MTFIFVVTGNDGRLRCEIDSVTDRRCTILGGA